MKRAKKGFGLNELQYALVWIGVYCLVSVPIRGNFGDESLAMLLALAAIAAGICLFIKKFRLAFYYGLRKWNGRARDYLWFLPILALTTGNLWGGVGMRYEGAAQVFAVLSMLLIGFIEEMIFRGFLFRALLWRDPAPVAITISAVTFGVGHIVNLLAGQGGLESLIQVVFAVAWGFLFTMVFYTSGSLWVCVIVHGLVDVCSKFAAPARGQAAEAAYVGATIVVSLVYCLWLRKKPSALREEKDAASHYWAEIER